MYTMYLIKSMNKRIKTDIVYVCLIYKNKVLLFAYMKWLCIKFIDAFLFKKSKNSITLFNDLEFIYLFYF